MKVAVVHSFYRSAEPSGENAVVRDQVEALRTAGHDVQLFGRATDDLSARRSYAGRAAATTLTGFGPAPALTGPAWSPDIVHVHNTFPNWGTRWARSWSSRLVVTLHNYRTVCAAGTLFRDGHECHDCLSRPILPAIAHGCYRGSPVQSLPPAVAASPGGALRSLPRVANRVIALNGAAGDFFQGVFGRSIDVIPNFVDESPRRTGAIEPVRWVYIGALADYKGILELLRDWPSDLGLDIYGMGPLEPQVRQEAAARGDRLVYHGLVPREELRTRLPSYKGLVIPSLCAEGLPTVALEALNAAVPLVLSDQIASAPDFVATGSAVAYSPMAPGSLRSALAVVDADRTSFSEQSRIAFSKSYSRDAWTSNITALYGEVVS